MPQLPRIAADQNVPVAAQVQHQAVETPLSIATVPNEALAKLGETVARVAHDWTQRIIQLRRDTQYDAQSTAAHLAIDANLRQQEDTPYDFADPKQADKYREAIAAGTDKIISDTLEKVKDPEVRARLLADLTQQREHAIIHSRDYTNQKELEVAHVQKLQSLDADEKTAIEETDPDKYSMALQTMQDRLNEGVKTGLWSAEYAYTEGIKRLGEIQTVRLDRKIENDPWAALADIVDDKVTGGMDPLKRQAARVQALNAIARKATEAKQARIELRDSTYSDRVSKTLNGQYSHSDLEQDREKFSFSADQEEHLFNLLDKPPKDAESDPATLDAARLAVYKQVPTISESQLMNMTRQQVNGAPALSTKDYTQLQDHLQSQLKALTAVDSATGKQVTLAESALTAALSADPDVLSAGRLEFAKALRSGIGNPTDIAQQIIASHQKELEQLGGDTKAKVHGNFISTRNQYEASVRAYAKFQQSKFGIHPIGNPALAADVETKKANYLTAAKAAGRVLESETAKTLPDGKTFILKDGRTAITLDGKLVIQ